MKLTTRRLVAAALALGAAPAVAHHSFAMFDASKTITVSSTVTEFQWTNPHSWLELDVLPGQEASTGFSHLSLEMTSISVLRNGGWGPRTLKMGDKVLVTYRPMRNGTAGGQLVSLRMADGRVLKN